MEGRDSLSCRTRDWGCWHLGKKGETVQRWPRLENMLLQGLLAPAKQGCEPTPWPWPSWLPLPVPWAESPAPGEWCCPPSPQLLPIPDFRRSRTLPCNSKHNWGFVIFVTAKPKKLWQHCHRLQKILRETNKIFLCSSVFVSREENHRVFSCQTIPTGIIESLGLGFEWFGVLEERWLLSELLGEGYINLSVWTTTTTKAPENSFFQSLLIFTIHSKSKCFC